MIKIFISFYLILLALAFCFGPLAQAQTDTVETPSVTETDYVVQGLRNVRLSQSVLNKGARDKTMITVPNGTSKRAVELYLAVLALAERNLAACIATEIKVNHEWLGKDRTKFLNYFSKISTIPAYRLEKITRLYLKGIQTNCDTVMTENKFVRFEYIDHELEKSKCAEGIKEYSIDRARVEQLVISSIEGTKRDKQMRDFFVDNLYPNSAIEDLKQSCANLSIDSRYAKALKILEPIIKPYLPPARD